MKNNYIKTSQGTLRYAYSGDSGPVTLLIPGLGGSIDNWQYNTPELAKHCQVYVLEPIGCGGSDKPPLNYTIDVLANSVKEFIELKQFDQVNLVANSLGGAISLKVTTLIPDKINKLVLTGSAGFSNQIALRLRIVSIPVLGELLFQTSKASTRKALHAFVYNPASITEDFVNISYENASRPGQKRVILNILRSHVNFLGGKKSVFKREYAAIKKITQPTLLIWGKQDPIIKYDNAKIALSTLCNSELHTFDHCGHLAQVEKAAEFNQQVLAFLQ